jgi:hypothetical protein
VDALSERLFSKKKKVSKKGRLQGVLTMASALLWSYKSKEHILWQRQTRFLRPLILVG